MKVILLKDTPKIGKKGELKDVSEGYANNFLIPKGFVSVATSQVQQKVQKEQREAQEKSDRDLQKLLALKQELEKRVFTIKVKTGDKGQVFGSVREKDIADSIHSKINAPVEKHQISISKPIHSVGEHQAVINLGHQIKSTITIKVESL